MGFRVWVGLTVAVTMMVMAGCGSRSTEPVEGTPDAASDQRPATEAELYEIWDKLCESPPEQVDFKLAEGVARNLAHNGIEKLNPLLERMGEEDASVTTYFLPLRILRPLLRVEHEPTLVALTQPDMPSRARRTATELLSAIGTESAVARVVDLMDAEDPDLAAAAVLARLHHGEEEAVSRVKPLWNNDAVSEQAKQEIIRRIPETAAPKHRDLFIAALDNTDWDPTVRQRAITILGSSTDEVAHAALEKAVDTQPEPQLQDLARKAANAVEERIASGLGELQFNTRSDGSKETRIELQSEPQDDNAAAE